MTLSHTTSLSLDWRGPDHTTVDKDLAGWSHSNNAVTGSVSLWRAAMSAIPQGLGLGQFNTFVGYMDSGTELTLSEFAHNTKL